jgi:hypothetical protein
LTAGCTETGCPKTALDRTAKPFVAGSTAVPPHDAIFLAP